MAWMSFLRCGLVLFMLQVCGFAAAHEIPAAVRVTAYLEPQGERLRLTIRLPMDAVQEVDFPIRGPGFVDVSRADAALATAAQVWLVDRIDIFEDGVLVPAPEIVATRISLASDRSFDRYESARAVFDQPKLADELDLVLRQQFFDAVLDYPIRSDRAGFAVRLRFQRLGQSVATALTFLPPDGPPRRFDLHDDTDLVPMQPRPAEVARAFLGHGFAAIARDPAALLLLASLVVALRRPRTVVVLGAAFAAGLLLALGAAWLGFMPTAGWFPTLVRVLTAAAIVAAGIDGILGSPLGRRSILALVAGLPFGYGLALGFGAVAQFAGDHPTLALLAYAAGSLAAVALALAAAALVLGLVFLPVRQTRLVTIVILALVTDVGWQWLKAASVDLAQFPPPVLDAAFLAGLLRALLAALLLAGAIFLVAALARSTRVPPARHPAE